MSYADGSPKPTCIIWAASDSKTTAARTLIHEDHDLDLDDDNDLDYVPSRDDSCSESNIDCDSDMLSPRKTKLVKILSCNEFGTHGFPTVKHHDTINHMNVLGKPLVKIPVVGVSNILLDSDDDYIPDDFIDLSSDDDFEAFNQCSNDDVDECFKDKFAYAVDNQHMYIRAVTVKDRKRAQNQKHSFLKCGRMVLHLGDHLKIHKGDADIDAIIACKENHKKVVIKDNETKGQSRLCEQQLYRNRDHHHNMAVLRENQGELIVAHRPSTSFSVSNVAMSSM